MSNFYRGNYIVRGEQVRRVINANDRIAEQMHKIEQEQRQARREELQRLREEAIANGASEDDPQFREGIFAEALELEPEEPEIDYVAQAKEQAEQILAEAREQADAIQTQAQADADALREQARQEGYQSGYETATQEAEAKLQAQTQELDAREQEREEQYEQTLTQLEPQLLDTMLTIFDEVFQMQFCGKREMLLQLVKNAMRGIRETKQYKIRVSEAEVAFLREHKEELREKVGEDVTIEIVMDPDLSDSQCVIDADSGVYDCSLDVELENLTRDLKSLSVQIP